MELNISKLEITQERMEKLLKIEEVIEKLKREEQPLSIRDFLSVIKENSFIFLFAVSGLLINLFFGDVAYFWGYMLIFISVVQITALFILYYQKVKYPSLDRIDTRLLKLKFDVSDTFTQSIIEHHSTKNYFFIPQFSTNMQAIKDRYKN